VISRLHCVTFVFGLVWRGSAKNLDNMGLDIMAQQSPWSVKGVRPECRVAAKVAARRSGLTIGEWLNRAIMDAAKQSIQGQEVATTAQQQLPAQPLHELTDAIETLSEHIQQQNQRQMNGGGGGGSNGMGRAEVEETVAPVMESVKQLEEEFEAKIEALQENINLSAEAAGDIDIGPIQARMQEAEAKADRANLALAPLERKVMRMAQDIERREAGAQETPAPRRRGGLLSRLFGG
jgi:localization factor PodJL